MESSVKSHSAVFDTTVVGIADERWGSSVCAIVQVRDEKETPSLKSIQEHCRKTIAGYKVPRHLIFVDKVLRSPSGKPDYRWAKKVADKN